MRLHQKVHQEIPVNNELPVAFARAFAYEYCKTMKEETNPKMYRVASIEWCEKMGNLQQKMARFWSMAVDDANVDSQQNPKETLHRHILKANVNDTGEILISDMLKIVHESWETLEETKFALDKATLAMTTIRNKIHISIFLRVRGIPLRFGWKHGNGNN